MSLLTEAEIIKREDIFFELVEDLVKEYYPDVELEPLTEDDAYLFSIMLEHFVDNYKNPTLHESYIASMTGQEEPDHNDELYQEIVDIILDESIGSKIASVAHGIQHAVAGMKARRALGKSVAATSKANVAKKKAGEYAKAIRKQPAPSGVTGQFKSSMQKGRSAGLQAKAAAAKEKATAASAKSHAAMSKHQEIGAKRAGLAHKIDTGISNVKKRVTGAIHKGASRLGHAIGRAGALVR